MFKQRLITMLVLIPVLIGIIYYASREVFIGVVVIFTMVGAIEWLSLIPVKKRLNQFIFMILIIMILLLCNFSAVFFNIWLLTGIISWFIIIWMIITYPDTQKYWDYKIIPASFALLYLPVFALSLINMIDFSQGKHLVLYILCLIWAADIGAYVAGKQFGKHKLLPNVSPGKTLEGSIGGLVFALLIAFTGFMFFKPYNILLWFIVAPLTILISMFGDLFISVLKRRCNVKDTGGVFPGHGGVLDRIDSLIAAIPVFYAALKFLSL